MDTTRADGRPKYQMVAEYIRGKVADGSWKPDDKVPSVRELAEQFDATATTVNNALRELKREGVLYGRQGSGTYVARHRASGLVEALQEAVANGSTWLNYSGPITGPDLIFLQGGGGSEQVWVDIKTHAIGPEGSQ